MDAHHLLKMDSTQFLIRLSGCWNKTPDLEFRYNEISLKLGIFRDFFRKRKLSNLSVRGETSSPWRAQSAPSGWGLCSGEVRGGPASQPDQPRQGWPSSQAALRTPQSPTAMILNLRQHFMNWQVIVCFITVKMIRCVLDFIPSSMLFQSVLTASSCLFLSVHVFCVFIVVWI